MLEVQTTKQSQEWPVQQLPMRDTPGVPGEKESQGRGQPVSKIRGTGGIGGGIPELLTQSKTTVSPIPVTPLLHEISVVT